MRIIHVTMLSDCDYCGNKRSINGSPCPMCLAYENDEVVASFTENLSSGASGGSLNGK